MNYTIVGIDFGTSTTVVKVKNYSEGTNPKDCLPLTFNGNSYLPTLIFEDMSNQLHFGYDAEAQVSAGIEGVVHKNFKMDLIGNSEQQAKAKWLIKEFFKYIYLEFNKNRTRLNVYSTLKTFVSYPAKWTSETRSLMKQCAIEAGFGTESNVLGESEPTAAIYASIAANIENLQKKHIIILNEPINVMMLDMGAGTSDIAIFKFRIDNNNKPIIDELITYPTVDNVYLCGGREIDELLADDLNKYVANISNNGQVSRGIAKSINGSAKKWKEQNLSPSLKENKTIDTPPGRVYDMICDKQDDGVYKNLPFSKIDRRRFELLTKHRWEELHSLITDAIKEAKEGKNKLSNFNGAKDIDLIVLTGGHSQWYGIKEFILGNDFAALAPINFSKIKQEPERLLQEAHPQETVANGLVYKDVGFDVKYTMGNSLWVRYTVEGKQSSFVPIARHNDVLPIIQQASFDNTVAGTLFRTDSIPVKCEFLFGSSITTAKTYTIIRNLPIPQVLLRYILGIVLGSPIAVVQFFYNWFSHGWDIAVEKAPELFQENYNVIITSDMNINEEEVININGKLKIGGIFETSVPIPFTIKIG